VSVIYGVTNTVTAAIGVGSDPDGVAVDAATDLAYVANAQSDTVSVIQMIGLVGFDSATVYEVGSDPTGVAVDLTTDLVYVTSYSSALVVVIGTFGSSYLVTGAISVGSEPYGVAVDETTDTVYVTNVGSDTLSLIDGANHLVTATVPVGSEPAYEVAVDANTGTIYTADTYSDTVSVLHVAPVLGYSDTATITVGSPPPGTGGNQLAVDAATDTAYVAFGAVSNTVSVVDLATGTVTATVDGGISPGGIAIDESTDTVYVTNGGSNTVSVINGADNAVTGTISVGSGPDGVAVDQFTNTAYVTNSGSNTVSVISGATNTVTATAGVGSGPEEAAVDEATDTVYISNFGADTVSVIDGSTNAVSSISVGYGASGLAVDQATDTVYVANFGHDTVSIIDGATGLVNATFDVGIYPVGTAVDGITDTAYVATSGETSGFGEQPQAPALSVITTNFASPPGAPTIGTATAGSSQASVAFGAPADNGGVAIGSYTVAATDLTDAARGGQTASGTTSPITVPGLTNGDSYTFTVTAKSFAPGAPSASSNSVTPSVPVPPVFTSPASATFTEGRPSSFTVTATGTPPPTFNATGTLPTGVTLASTGVLSGTPTQNGVFPLTITASNGSGTPATQSFRLTVDSAPVITSPATATFTKGVKGSFTPKAIGFPLPKITKSGALPAGVKFTGGKLTGTPTVTGTFSITLTANNGIGTEATQAFTLKVLGFHISTLTLPAGTRGVAYSAHLAALGGTAPLAWKATTALPSGLKLSSSGLVSGTVPKTEPAGTYTFKVRVSDSTLPAHRVATATVTVAFS
jgi:YVTN family beta-propeller protein